MRFLVYSVFLLLGIASNAQSVLLKNVSVIDGTGKSPKDNMEILIKDGRIHSINKSSKKIPADATVVDLNGKTIIPMLTNAHAHIGLVQGTTNSGTHFTRDNLVKELKRYLSYGIGSVLSMGTDQELIFALRDSSRAGKLPGADIYTGGYGFRTPTPNGRPETGMEKIFRPTTPEQARENIRTLASLKPDVVKIWVDDNGGTAEKMKPEIYEAIISESHKNAIRVAAHVYYLEDAHRLLDAGVDIFAHSIRDKEVDDALIQKMKSKGTVYIPTLTRDGYEIFYTKDQPWINDPFFTASLEPGVLEMITSAEYKNRVANGPQYTKNIAAYNMALRNLKKIHAAGILVALGTDSGAFPVRSQGFSEHLELQLMVDAGLTPLEVITIATRNASRALKASDQGTIEPGKKADFIVLDNDPSQNIKATQSIHAVWKNGKAVNNGPLAK